MPRISVARAQFGVRRAPFHSCWPGFDSAKTPTRDASGLPVPTSYLHRFDFGWFVIDVTVRA